MNTTKLLKTVACIGILFFLLTISPNQTFAFSGGTGTQEDPYIVSTPNDLNSIRNYLGSGYSDTYFKMGNSIDMDVSPYNTGNGWSRFGNTSSTAFYGHFDGDNNIIYNLYINADGTDYNSLFGYIGTGAVVENFGLEDLGLTLTNSPTFAYNAGIAGYNYGTIQNVYVTGSISGANHYTGGIAAYNSSSGTIQRCYSEATLTGTHYNGGIVARASGTIQDVYNKGTVNGSLYTAGIAGQYYVPITRAYNAGVINGSTEAAIASLNGGGGSAVDSFYDSTISLASGVGTATTTANMKLQDTYTNWDFDTVWVIDPNNNDGYPYFQWKDIPPTEAPSTQATNVTATEVKYNQMKISWTNGDGDRRMVFMKEGTGTESPVDASGYVPSSEFGNGSQIGTSGWYTVYDGTGTNVTVTNLEPNTAYTIQVFEFNGKAHNGLYLTSTGTNNPKTISTIQLAAPTTQASNISFSNLGSSTMTVTWDAGNGDGSIVLMKRASTGYTSLTNGTTYTANSSFGDGSQIGTSGWYVVYQGTEETVSVSNLIAERNYIVQVISYNGSSTSIKYNNNTAANNPKYTTTTEFIPNETFETGDFSLFDWNFDGTLDWIIEESTVYQGIYSARSGNITHSQSTTMQVTMEIPEDGTISFYRKISSEGSYDYLRFYIDGVQQGAWSGSYDWAQQTYNVTAGTRTFKWTYSKDGSASVGLDAAYIDNIEFPMSGAENPAPDHTISYATDGHGTLTGTTSQTVTDGDNGTVIQATPKTGFHFVRWSDGITTATRTDLDVGHSFEVQAIFEIDMCTVTYTAGSNGSISGTKSQSIEYGSNSSLVKAIANSGYRFLKWSDGLTTTSRTDSNIISNLTYTALFEKIPTVTQTTTTPTVTTTVQTVQETKKEEEQQQTEDVSEQKEEEFTNEQIEEILKEEKLISKVYKKDDQLVVENVLVRLLDSEGNPLVGVKVTLHSDPITGYTNDNGVVIFKDVPIGEHHIEFDYEEEKYSEVLALETSNIEVNEETEEDTTVEIPVITISTSKTEEQTNTNYPPYILAGVGIAGLILVIYLHSKKKNI